uniref:Splicing factor, suppressor of white-apricot homolog n=1 Tax=Phallusia mammillata TaxID=59560 RepID=A0A6F9DRE3_9ASCI|nr:splicing factor, suppressor of white-apricot homolog [Phallusia mammillata]
MHTCCTSHEHRGPHAKQILKKSSRQPPNDDEMLVFGYASKLYPPDSNSAVISKNKHLILWNGDEEVDIKIDRYDCRASLYDLSEFDGDSWNKTYQQSEEETRLEEKLDEERYRALKINEMEENVRQEEEMKRLHASISSNPYQQVGFKYGDEYDPSVPTTDTTDVEESVTDDKPFIAPTSLAVPTEMEIPPTEKMNAIIEKTATFVSKQGTQMEIVLKAKQSNNSQFQFLQFGHYLNPYYKHMVKRIRDGKYCPGAKDNEQDSNEDSDSSSDGEGYLHPSLFAAAHKQNQKEKDEKTKAIRTIDPEHPLAKLIEKGRAANAAKQYQQMVDTVYSYYHQQNTESANGGTQQVEPPPLPMFETMSSQFSTDMVLPQPHYPETPAPPGEEAPGSIAPPPLTLPPHMTTGEEQLVPPSPDMQPIVEAVARKIATEGEEVEMSLATQDNPNYAFLRPWHELHPYYKYRKTAWLRLLNPPPPPETKEAELSIPPETPEESPDKTEEVKPSAPISFSIKPRSESSNKILATVDSKTSKILAEPESDGKEIVLKVENVETRKVRRKFTEEAPPGKFMSAPKSPPGRSPTITEDIQHAPTEIGKICDETQPQVESLIEPQTQVVPPIQPSPPSPPPKPASNFTAVTSTGEAASVSLLRQKQAARRMKALQFLKAKQKQEPVVENTEQIVQTNPANEDIFDLSSSPKPEPISPEKENSPDLSNVAPSSTDQTNNPKTSDPTPANTRLFKTVKGVHQKVIYLHSPAPQRHRSSKGHHSSPLTSDKSSSFQHREIPSAYRQENREKSLERDRRSHKRSSKHRSRTGSSSPGRKHKRSRKHVNSKFGERKKKKRKKEKSRKSVESDEPEDGQISDRHSHGESPKCEPDLTEETNKDARSIVDVTKPENNGEYSRSEGEIESD